MALALRLLQKAWSPIDAEQHSSSRAGGPKRMLCPKLWPQKFRFWPKSPAHSFWTSRSLAWLLLQHVASAGWLLPAETDELCGWLDKHKARESNSASKEKLAGCLCFRLREAP